MTTDLELDSGAQGQTVMLATGQGLRLRLVENPTTGYQWSVSSSGDLFLESSLFTPVGAAVGGGGTREWRWCARTAGSNQVTLALRRVWEPIDKAITRFTMTVIVAGR